METTIWQGGPFDDGTLIWPQADQFGPTPSPDLPPPVRDLYDEARGVAPISPRAASALIRLALEALLEDLYGDDGSRTLNQMIGAASADGLPQTIIDAMDVLRFNGNAAIHELDRADTTETAESLFRVLNLVAERLITQPRQISDMTEALPQTVRAAIDRRDSRPPDAPDTPTT